MHAAHVLLAPTPPSYDSPVNRSLLVTLVVFVGFSSEVGAATTYDLEDQVVLFGWSERLSAARISPDGAHVYVAGSEAVSVHRVIPATGGLAFVERARLPVDPFFNGANDVAITTDGKHLYAPVGSEHLVVGFERDAVTGRLTQVDVVKDGVDGVDGLFFPNDIVASPDGAHVYVASTVGDSLAVFSRNATTGELTFVEAQFDGVGGVTGLQDFIQVTISPDGSHVYTGARFFDGTIWTGALAVFRRDAGTGALTFVEAIFDDAGATGLTGVFQVILSPNGEHLYAVNGGGILRFERNAGTGELTQLGAEAVGSVTGLAFSPDGAFVYGLDGPAGAQTLFTMSRDAVSGTLTSIGTETAGITGQIRVGREGTVSPDGQHFFLPDTNDGPTRRHTSLNAYTRDLVTGALAFAGGVADLVDTADVAMTADGAHLYTAAVANDALAAFQRDAGTGALTMIETEFDGVQGVTGLDGARSVALSPDEAHVYVVAQEGNSLAVFARDAGTGALSFIEAEFDGVGGVDGLEDAQFVVVSPDGDSVYVARNSEGVIAVFSRNVVSGEVTFVETEPAAQADRLAVSPTGDVVYSSRGQSFARDPATKELSPLQTFSDDPLGLIAISPGGEHVYGLHEGYTRDPATGLLTDFDDDPGGLATIFGLKGGFAFTQDGSRAFAGPVRSIGTLHVFERDPTAGSRSFVHATPFSCDVNPATGEGDVAVSPDGQHVYLACDGGDAALQIHTAGYAGCAPTLLVGCRTGTRGSFQLKDKSPNRGDKVNWRWIRGAETTLAEFEPSDAFDHYAVCAYDGLGNLIVDLLVPAGQLCGKPGKTAPCFSTKDPKVLYKSTQQAPEGIKKMKLKADDDGRASFTINGGRDRLGWVDPPALPLALPVVAQLQSKDGLCFESTFPFAYRNDPEMFGAKF